MIDKMREEFEAALLSEKCASCDELVKADWIARGSDGEYRSYFVRGAWWSWQASRAALVVELPAIESMKFCPATSKDYDSGFDHGQRQSRSDFIEAIHAVGVTAK